MLNSEEMHELSDDLESMTTDTFWEAECKEKQLIERASLLLHKSANAISNLPRYADEPENGEMAGMPFVPRQSPCHILNYRGISTGLFWDGRRWIADQRRIALIKTVITDFYVSSKAARRRAERAKKETNK